MARDNNNISKGSSLEFQQDFKVMITVKPGAWVAMRRLIVGLLAMLSLTQGIAQAQTCPGARSGAGGGVDGTP